MKYCIVIRTYYFSQGRIKWWALVSPVMKFRLPMGEESHDHMSEYKLFKDPDSRS